MSPFRELEIAPPPWIVGHRGAGGEALENTLPSFLRAAAQGADMVETDLQLAADGVLVACHDRTLDRLAGRGTAVEETSSTELTAIPLLTASETEESARIPTLPAILRALPNELPLNLELKRFVAPVDEVAAALVDSLAAAAEESPGTAARILVSSFDWELLAAVRRLGSPLLASPQLGSPLLAPIGRRHSPGLLTAAAELGAWSVHCHRRRVTPGLLTACREAGRPLLAYTVNDAAEAGSLLGLGVAGLFTDFPGELRRQLEAQLEDPLEEPQ